MKVVAKEQKEQMAAILPLLKKAYPDARCALDFKNPLQLLVATILSAQCTDVMVNKVTPALFAKYKSAGDFAKAPKLEIESFIKSTGFYHNKAKNIQGACKIIAEKHDGEVPKQMEKLLELPGVARKTATVVLFNAFGIIDGITVDTHVTRLSHRLGLSKENVATKIEIDLMKITPRRDWGMLSHYLIAHGRKVCKAQKPLCELCVLKEICPSVGKFNHAGKWIGPK